MMESMFRWLLGLLIVLGLAGFGVYSMAARGTPPVLIITKPDRVIGQTGAVEVTADAPNARFARLSIARERGGKNFPLFPRAGAPAEGVTQVSRNELRIARAIGRANVPDLKSGPARIVVTASRPSLLNLT